MKLLSLSAAVIMLLSLTTPTLNVKGFQLQVANPRILLDPSNITLYTKETEIGDKFNVTAWVQGAPNIGAWQLRIDFNDSVINMTRWVEPVSDPQYIFAGKTTFTPVAPPDGSYVHDAPGKGHVEMAAILYPTTQQPSNGDGELCIVEFILASYPVSGEISSELHINTTETYMLFYTNGQEVPDVIKEDGLFRFVYGVTPPPSPPYLAVDPSSIIIGNAQNITGMPFTINLLVMNLQSSLHLSTISLILSYNQSLLQTSESKIALSSLWGSGSTISVNNGEIDVVATNPSNPYSTGTVLVGVITFMAYQATSPPQPLDSYESSSLTFVYTMLRNSTNGQIAQASPVNGSIEIYPFQSQSPLLEITEPVGINQGGAILVSEQFQSNVTISGVLDLRHVGVLIRFNQSVISCLMIQLGAELGQNMTQISQTIDNANGYVYEEALVSGPTALSGTLFTFTFRAEALGTSWLNFSLPYGVDTFLTDSNGTVISAKYSEKEISIVNEVPEYGSPFVLPLLIMITLLTVAVHKRKKTSAHHGTQRSNDEARCIISDQRK